LFLEDLLTDIKKRKSERRIKTTKGNSGPEGSAHELSGHELSGHEMSEYSGAHYADIYDPEVNPDHARTRHVVEWDTLVDGSRVCYETFIPYEGYGQGKCREKTDFLASINVDHPLWSPGGYGKSGNKVGKRGDTEGKYLMFGEEIEVRVIGENETITEGIDCSVRPIRASWNFSLMLTQFVEKCKYSQRPSFFKEGGVGMRWAEDIEMMKDFKRWFDWIDNMIELDENKKISLSDQTVKNYPRNYYEQISGLYKIYMEKELGPCWAEEKTEVNMGEKEEMKSEEKSFKFNPNAAVFVPSVIFSPAMEKDSPPKPDGPAPRKNRPHSTGGPDHFMSWRICEESDKKILELDRKLQMLINLHGPVVEAEHI